jgi:hypothetical protein
MKQKKFVGLDVHKDTIAIVVIKVNPIVETENSLF